MVAKLNFQQPLLQSLSHDPSEIILISWFGAQEAFLLIVIIIIIIIISVESSCAAQYVYGNSDFVNKNSIYFYFL